MNHWTDKQVFSAIKDGNKIALSELFERFYDDLKHYGNYVAKDHALAEECIQELFIYIFEAHSRLADVQSVKSYLFTALRRRVIEAMGKRRSLKSRELEVMNRVDIQFVPQDILEDLESNRSSRLALSEALNNLSFRQREAIYLRYYNNLSTKEIADVMGVANQTVLNMLYQALQKIRKDESILKLLS